MLRRGGIPGENCNKEQKPCFSRHKLLAVAWWIYIFGYGKRPLRLEGAREDIDVSPSARERKENL